MTVGVALLIVAQPAQAKDDFQYGSTLEIGKRLNQKWDLVFRPEMRMEDSATHLFYHGYRQGVRFRPWKHLEIGGKPLVPYVADDLSYDYTRDASVSGSHPTP